MIPKVREWLDTQGFTLEMRTASAFRAAGFEVRQSSYYLDPETAKGREIDVVARDPDVLGVVDITFIVECKSSKKPWVLLCSPDTVAGYNRFFAFGALSKDAIGVLAGRVIELLPRVAWLRKEGLIGYSLRQALSDSDVAYAAAIGVAKACDSQINRPETEYAPPYAFAFPVIVVDSPILQCWLGHDGSIEVSEVEQGEFLFVARLPRYFGSCIRLLSVNRLMAFAREAKAAAEALRTELKIEEQRVVESWHARKPKS
jgi:hypothetical protein